MVHSTKVSRPWFDWRYLRARSGEWGCLETADVSGDGAAWLDLYDAVCIAAGKWAQSAQPTGPELSSRA